MLILNLLTGTDATGVSITKDKESLIAISIEGGIRQSETIFQMMKDAFNYVEYGFSDLDAVSVLKGPGSFTGLRVGMAAAKAISYSHDIPIIPVDTLKAIIFESEMKSASAMMDARRGRVYFLNEIEKEPTIATVEDLKKLDAPRYLFGENILKYKDILKSKNYILLQRKEHYLSIKGLEKAALEVQEKDYESYNSVILNYLKSKEEVVDKNARK
ncbi:MAG: tRNA (adenosine(37)-N6)-threonylcarbamoyltransferase complex dimerization subunit type 1 TsaB [Firmicutes bacterium]|nr:tRNA (adenosine(37)-N6)-threonylcarbamoyltransferase complex dimerization subunit type 1 TsaB [Bacillota bacterium]